MKLTVGVSVPVLLSWKCAKRITSAAVLGVIRNELQGISAVRSLGQQFNPKPEQRRMLCR